ncbi:ATP-grasp domain-containing protein [Cohnella sp.]|uniref:carboxylate--amine ligase n=1 Tax=Cohnella sp. TaxID=1883426 RepID=UPI003568B9D2
MSTVLFTNGLFSKTLAAVRSLGSRGIRTITSDKTIWHTSGFSKYASKNVTYPNPKKSPGNFLDWLVTTIRKERCDVLFPMDDDTLEIVVANRKELDRLVRIVAPASSCYNIAADKGNTIRLAMERGIPCPKTVEISGQANHSEDDFLEAIQIMEYPLVIKPRRSSGSRGIRIVHNRNEFIKTLREIQEVYPNPIIQEWIPPGIKCDVCLCYDSKHKLVASFVQKEIRNFPITRGPSTVHESIWYPELIKHSTDLMKGIPWCGVVDVEYMIDPRSGVPKLMEINPRFWSSLHLSIRSGVDFPWIMYQLAMEQKVEPISDYIVGKRGRALLPGDVLHFLSNPKRFQMNPPIWTTKLPDDMVSLHDPLPTVGFLLSALRYSVDINTWKFLIKR